MIDALAPLSRILALAPGSGATASASRARPPRQMPRGPAAWCLALLLGPLCVPASAGPKIDVVHLKNGDRITCEIKKLDRALLTVSTDPMDTVSLHWDSVGGVASPRLFEIELASGELHYGSPGVGSPGELLLTVLGRTPVNLRMVDVIRLTPIGRSWWGRMDGNIDLGFSFAQASLETRWTLNAGATYRSHRYRVHGTVASQLTAREDADRLLRNTVSLTADRTLGGRWFTIALAQAQQNQELDLNLRALGGGGFGRYFSQTNYRLVSGYAGLVYTHENFAGQPAGSSAEGVLGGMLDFFTPRSDNFSFSNALVSFYNLGGRARARVELESVLRYEFYKDFYWAVNGFESFDSTPPENQKRNDAGVSLTLGWKF
jgi:hypothetical protein